MSRSVEARVVLDGAASYRGAGQASELGDLGRALGLARPGLLVGAGVHGGVCCVDLELSSGTAVERRVRIHLARGATKVNAKAKERRVAKSDFCDSELDVEAEVVR